MSIKNSLGEDFYNEILEKSCIVKGNSQPIKKAFEKETIKIGFLGGSITYGYFPNGTLRENGFTFELEKSLKSNYPEKSFEFLNLGISGTNCIMGIILSEHKLREFSPDIIFTEYAVNEENSPDGIERYESLIKKLLSFDNSPAVIPISVLSEGGYTCEEYTNLLAEYYSLFAMGLKNSVFPLFEQQKLQWSEYASDEGHPIKSGHTLISDCLLRLIDIALNTEYGNYPHYEKAFFSDKLSDLTIVDLAYIFKGQSVLQCFNNYYGFDKCFFITGKVSFNVECKNLAVVFVQSNSESYTDCDIAIDNDSSVILQGYSIFGWENPIPQMIIKGDKKAVHHIEISPQKKGGTFILCAIAY